MKTLGKYITGLFLAGLCLGTALFLSCENPVRAGLGPQVDIKDPTVELTSPKPGGFLNSDILFEGTAWDDIALKGVWIRLGETGEWIQTKLDKSSGRWTCSYDTNLLIDGDLKVRLKVEDAYGRSVQTADMAYVVKNGKPGVKIAIPLIETYTSANAPAEFNKGDTESIPPAAPFENSRRQDSGGSLMGVVTDLRGIQQNGVKIKFWPVETYPGEGNIPPDDPSAAGYNPLYTWHDPVISEEDQQAGMTTVDFSFPYTIHEIDGGGKLKNTEAPLPANKYYRFQIKAVDMFGSVFVYPQDLYPQGAAPDNKYVEVYIRSADEEPKINLHLKKLLDNNGALTPYDDRTTGTLWDINTAVIPRRYIEGRTSFFTKNFMLQVETSHSEGIGKVDFRITNEQNLPVSGYDWVESWDTGYIGIVETDEDTFNPPTATGIKTIKYYRKTFGTVDGFTGPSLGEGKYTFHVRAHSASGTAVTREYDFYIDETPPSITLEGIKGALTDGDAYRINQIVSPTVRFSDGTGSKIRPADPAAPVEYGPREQKWFIVSSTEKTAVDTLANDPFWYPADDYFTSPAFTVLQHSWLEEDSFKIQTGFQSLSDGGTYYLYVFARDNSFNVNHEVYELIVDENSDKPVYTFAYGGGDPVGLIDPGVDDPDYGDLNSFLQSDGTIHNKLNSTDIIRFRVADDDSLDLGYNNGPSSLKVYITGTYVDAGGQIQKLTGIDPDYRQALTDAQVKNSFQANGLDLVTSRIGEISQEDLKTALSTYTGYTSGPYKLADSAMGLPDGIYFMEIEVSDLPSTGGDIVSKIGGRGDTLSNAPPSGSYSPVSPAPLTPSAATTTESFYFVVDTTFPAINITSHTEGGYLARTNTFTGTISDSNGPFSDDTGGPNAVGDPDKLTVRAEKKGRNDNSFADATGEITVSNWSLTPDSSDPLMFVSNWSASVDLNNTLNTFTGQIRLTFSGKDRFGGVGSHSVTLIVDNSPPELRLSSVPRTVKRGAVSNYVNQVIEFTLGVRDDYPIEGVKWGIIPKTGFDSIKNHTAKADLAADYNDLATKTPDTTHTYGDIDVARAGYTVRYNTANLAGGEYVLYAIAKDKAGNYSPLDGIAGGSAGTKLPFHITVDQDTDKPSFDVYKSTFRPAEGSVVGRSDLVIEGRITDDDGFNVDFANPELPPVQIQYGYNDGTAKETDWITLPNGQGANVSLWVNGDTDVIFRLDLNKLDSQDPAGYNELSAIGIGPDQLQWVKIKAHDSAIRKYNTQTNNEIDYDDITETTQVSNELTLNFTLDTVSPVIALELLGSPPNPVFGPGNNGSFGLKITVTEANLAAVTEGADAGKGVIQYRLDDGATVEYLIDTANHSGDVWTVAALPNALDSFYKDQPDGPHVITVTAVDRSGKTGLGTVSFTKDLTPPSTLIAGMVPYPERLPPPPAVEGTAGTPEGSLSHSWYYDPSLLADDAARQAWYAEQTAWLLEHDVPVLTYRDNLPSIKGSFTDSVSPIKLTATSGETFSYRLDGASSWTDRSLEGQGKNVNWTIPLPTGLVDGVHSVSFKVSDTTGNENTADQENWYVFRLDHHSPVLKDIASDPAASSFGAGFKLRGTAEDPNLKTVILSFKDVNGSEKRTVDLADTADPNASFVTKRQWTYRTDDSLTPLTDTTGIRFEWEYTIDDDLYDLLGINTNTDGTCTVEIRAVDYSDSEDTALEWNFVRDGTAPTVTPAGLTAAAWSGSDNESPLVTAANMTKFNTVNPQIQGEAKDAQDRTALGSLQTYIEYWNYNSTADNKWALKEDWKDLTTGAGASLVTPANTSPAVNFTKYLGSSDTTPGASNLADGIYRIRFRAADRAAPANMGDDGPWYVFIIDRKQPVIATTPAAYTDPMSNNESVTGASHQMTFTGTVTDENQITEVKAKVLFTNYPPSPEAPAELTGGTYDNVLGKWTYTWTVKVAANDNPAIIRESCALEISAQDIGQSGPITLSRGFTLDNAPPSGHVEVPPAISGNTSAEVTAETTLTGSVAEPNGVSFLGFYMSPAPLSSDAIKALGDGDFTPAGTSWQPSSIGVDESTDFSGWTGNLVNFGASIYDWNLNIREIGVLTAPFRRNGVSYNYSNDPDDPYYDAEYGPVSTAIAKAVDGEVGIYQINFLFRVRDKAGNVYHFDRLVKVNPRGDIPTVSINNPKPVEVGNPRGGTISADGGATDNQSVYAVIFRVIEYKDDGTAPNKAVYMKEYENAADGLADWADALISDLENSYPSIVVGDGDTRQGWMLASIGTPDKNVNWTGRINSGGEIDTTVKRKVDIEVRSVDWNVTLSGPGKISAPEIRTIWVTSGAPEITGVEVNGEDVITSPPVRGDYTITATVKDTASGGYIKTIQWLGQARNASSEALHDISSVTSSGSDTGYVDGSGTPVNGRYPTYTVRIPIESKKVLNNAYNKSAGTYAITLRVENGQGHSAEQSITVNIDNFTPFRDIKTYSNEKAAGTDYYVVGKVWDYDQASSTPEVRDLDKVVAWFTRNGSYEYLREGTGPAVTTASVTAVSGRTGPAVDGTSVSITYPDTNGFKVILGPDSEYATDSNGDGYFPTNFTGTDPGAREWSFKLDTTLLDDGVLTLHYLVYDKAGNVSYYTQEITIMNNPPVIDEVVLATDPLGLNRLGFDPLDEAERHKTIRENWHETGFKAWSNQLAFQVKTLPDKGNGRMHYRIFPATQVEAETSELTIGEIYTIKTLGTGVPWGDLGAPALRSEDGSTHFMAKAKTSAPTDGKVWKYVVPHESLKKTQDGPAASGQYHDAVIFTYSGSDFGSGKINPTAADNKYWFIIKVWDSVYPSNAEADQLSDFVVVGLNVLGPETVKPVMDFYDLNPYTETTVIDSNADDTAQRATLDEALDPISHARNRERGGLYNRGTNTELRRSGHIDPRNGTAAVLTAADKPGATYSSSANYTRDQVSGQVILRGNVSDNRRIDQIRLKIGSRSPVTVFSRVNGALTPQGDYRGKVVETLNWNTGNQVEWALLWDSETLRDTDNQVIKNDVAVELIAADTSNNVNLSDSNSTTAVDLVPYVTGFKRDGTRLSSRSKQGWFSFDRKEANITVEGFNLTNAKSGVTLSVGGVAATVAYINTENAPPFTVKVSLNDAAAPGAIAYKANSVSPLNDNNDDSKSWNSFYHPNTPGSRLWQDNLNAHIWVSDQGTTLGSDRTYMTNSANAEYVSMDWGPTLSNLFGSFSVASSLGVYVSTNRDTARTTIRDQENDLFRETDIDVISGNYGVVYNYVRDYDATGGIFYNTSNSVQSNANNPGRFMNPRISLASQSSDYRYISYYDAQTKRFMFANNATEVSLDGPGKTANLYSPGTSPDDSADAGLWSAVDKLSRIGGSGDNNSNYPIVVYYDAANATLRLMYPHSAFNPGTSANGWRRQDVIPGGDTYDAKSGEYVSMKVQMVGAPSGSGADRNYQDIIHLAFYNAEYKTVVYARGTWNSTGKNWVFTTTAVDNNVKSVAWTDISLDSNNNPWITYGDGNRLGNYDGAKVAYLNTTKFSRVSEDENNSAKLNTGWEAMYVPAGYIVKNGRINIEAYPSSPPTWAAAVGYQSDMFRIAYMLKE